MSIEDNSLWLVFNCEIYNYLNLREKLESKGHTYRTSSDTEAIEHLYEEYGDACVEHLNGMFAFALWDSHCKRLFLARDRMGIKPLYYTQTSQGRFLFASEIKALLTQPDVTRSVNTEVLEEFLTFHYVLHPNTIFESINSLPPGHTLVWKDGDIRIHQYWERSPEEHPEPDTESALLEELKERLWDSTRYRLISDVPLGTFNSGGIDSSLVTAIVSEFPNSQLNTFSVGFHEKEWDERPFAKLVSERFHTTHHTIVVEEDQYADLLPKVIWHHDEPLNQPHCVHFYLLCKLAKHLVTVVLTGEGSDELFAGYPRYNIIAIASLMNRFPKPMTRSLGELLKVTGDHRLTKLSDNFNRTPLELTLRNSQFVPEYVARPLISSDILRDGFRERSALFQKATAFADRSPLSRMLYFDQKTYLVSLLNRMDKMSMAWGLEARVPFLDHRLVNFSHQVPARHKMRWFQNKRLLKKLALRYLPPAIVHRHKSGFGVPISQWFRNERFLGRYLDLLLERGFQNLGYFKSDVVEKIVSEHRARKQDYGNALWALTNFAIWHSIFIEQSPSAQA